MRLVMLVMGTIAVALCVNNAWGDETVFTCKDAITHSYSADGGYSKPGWSADKNANVTMLIRKIPADLAKTGSFYDIQTTTQHGKLSSLKEGCVIQEILDSFMILNLDQAFVVTCKEWISTYLFYTRSGVPQLLETHLFFPHSGTAASVTATKDCKKGD
jgi:hypothetical protein